MAADAAARGRRAVAAPAEVRAAVAAADVDRGRLPAAAAEAARHLGVAGKAHVQAAVGGLAHRDRGEAAAATALADGAASALRARAAELGSAARPGPRQLLGLAAVVAGPGGARAPVAALADRPAALAIAAPPGPQLPQVPQSTQLRTSRFQHAWHMSGSPPTAARLILRSRPHRPAAPTPTDAARWCCPRRLASCRPGGCGRAWARCRCRPRDRTPRASSWPAGFDALDQVAGGAVQDLAQHDENPQVQALGAPGDQPPDLRVRQLHAMAPDAAPARWR